MLRDPAVPDPLMCFGLPGEQGVKEGIHSGSVDLVSSCCNTVIHDVQYSVKYSMKCRMKFLAAYELGWYIDMLYNHVHVCYLFIY